MPFHAARLLRAMNNELVHSTLNGTTSTVRCGICYGSIGEVCCTEQYDKTSCRSLINDIRVDLFARKGRDVLHIPPTQGCLIEHVKRAAYQAGYCWSQSLIPMAVLPQPEGWGWTKLLKVHGKFSGANSLRQAKCAESSYVVGAQKAAEQIANARKLHCPLQLYASVLDHASMNS